MPGCVAKRNKKFEKSLEKAADYAEKSFEKVVCDDYEKKNDLEKARCRSRLLFRQRGLYC